MSFKKWGARVCALFLICVALAGARAVGGTDAARAASEQPKPAEVEMMAAEELKRKVDRNEPVTIIDVRASDSYINSDGKIKGAIHVRPRRLKARLGVAPLKDIPRDREVVTYCACPADKASIRAAQLLSAAGFKRVRVLKGGWQAWLDTRGQVETKPRGI
jgi:rhodanese-related sulfurtransferase